jgi:hypothetical protein
MKLVIAIEYEKWDSYFTITAINCTKVAWMGSEIQSLDVAEYSDIATFHTAQDIEDFEQDWKQFDIRIQDFRPASMKLGYAPRNFSPNAIRQIKAWAGALKIWVLDKGFPFDEIDVWTTEYT